MAGWCKEIGRSAAMAHGKKALGAEGKGDLFKFDPDKLVLIEDKKHPLYDERVHLPIDEALVLNMMFAPDGVPQGVLVPVHVRKNPETGDTEVVNGRQRVKAAREANKRLKKRGLEPFRVPAVSMRATDVRAMGVLISTNAHAQEETPIGKAQKAQRYIDLGRDESEVATLLGISVGSVKNHLALLDAPAVVRRAVDSGQVTASVGYKLAKLEPAEAKKRLEKIVAEAPRVPGKKRSTNGARAKSIADGVEPAAVNGGGDKKLEDAVAAKIAAWLRKNWSEDGNWDGSLGIVPDRIEAGEWRA